MKIKIKTSCTENLKQSKEKASTESERNATYPENTTKKHNKPRRKKKQKIEHNFTETRIPRREDNNERMPPISKKQNIPRREKRKNVEDLKEIQQTQKTQPMESRSKHERRVK